MPFIYGNCHMKTYEIIYNSLYFLFRIIINQHHFIPTSLCKSPIEWYQYNPDLDAEGGRFPWSKICVQFGIFDADIVFTISHIWSLSIISTRIILPAISFTKILCIELCVGMHVYIHMSLILLYSNSLNIINHFTSQ